MEDEEERECEETRHLIKMLPPPESLRIPLPSLPLPACRLFSSQPTPDRILHDALVIRHRVFVQEQGCAAENEIDADDGRSWHWVVYGHDRRGLESNGSIGLDGEQGDRPLEPLACVRLIPPAKDTQAGQVDREDKDAHVKLGRLAVLPHVRRQGLARALCSTALDWARSNRDTLTPSHQPSHPSHPSQPPPHRRLPVLVHAQLSAEGMWARLGFSRSHGMAANAGSAADMGEWDEEGIRHCGMWKIL